MSTATEIRAQEPVQLLATTRSAPTWWVVFVNEVHGLWIGGKAPILLLLYSIVLGGNAFVTAFNVELSLLPPKEMVYEILRTAISVGVFMGMIIGADMISGERERGTLDVLLFTPTSRRQIVLGKLLAALTPWPVALALVVPFMAILSQGDEVLGPAIFWVVVLGTVMTVAYTATGLLISFWSNTNRTSYLVALGIYILILVPAQLPGRAQQAAAGRFLQQLNPIAAMERFVEKILVNNRTVEEFAPMLWSPLGFLVISLLLLLGYSAPRLRLEADRASLTRPRHLRAFLLGIALFAIAVAWLVNVQPATARTAGAGDAPMAAPASEHEGLVITVDASAEVLNQGDSVFFESEITNTGTAPTPLTVVAMNIINLDANGDVVDPEDWSPQRTQYVDPLAPGASTRLEWRVNAILDGDYLVYMVALPEPADADSTTQAVASSNVHLTVEPFNRLNPRGILPLVIGAPIVLAVGTALLLAVRRRETDGLLANRGFRRPLTVGAGVVVAMALLSTIAVASQGPASVAPDGAAVVDPGEPTEEPEPPERSAEPSPEDPEPSASADPSGEPAASEGPAPAPVELSIDTATEPEEFFYVQTGLAAPAGSTITLTLNNLTDADDEVGHNWVLVRPGQEEAVLANGITAGDDRDWLDVDDPGIIAHTALIEGEDSDAVTFAAPEPGTYTFVCTFPEHHANGMHGTLTIG